MRKYLAALAFLVFGLLIYSHASTCKDIDCCWANFTSRIDDCGDRYGPPGNNAPPEDPEKKEVRMAQLKACLEGAVAELVSCVGSIYQNTHGLNDGSPIYTTGSFGSPEVYSYEVYVPTGSEGTWQLQIANGLGAYQGSTPNLLARVAGKVEVNGVTVLDDGVWTGSTQRILKAVTLAPGVNTVTFEVYQADDSDFGEFYPLLYRE
ncbi:MAG: hypothetical protein Q9Q40_13705 [Acidobacteriota bacterium]|nr:hypothetical protein [Acidobacteriota bacterium]